jgi:hypothetical protein
VRPALPAAVIVIVHAAKCCRDCCCGQACVHLLEAARRWGGLAACWLGLQLLETALLTGHRCWADLWDPVHVSLQAEGRNRGLGWQEVRRLGLRRGTALLLLSRRRLGCCTVAGGGSSRRGSSRAWCWWRGRAHTLVNVHVVRGRRRQCLLLYLYSRRRRYRRYSSWRLQRQLRGRRRRLLLVRLRPPSCCCCCCCCCVVLSWPLLRVGVPWWVGRVGQPCCCVGCCMLLGVTVRGRVWRPWAWHVVPWWSHDW